MSAANGLNNDNGAARSALRRCATNVIAALAVLARPVRPHSQGAWPVAPRQLAIVAGAGLLIFLLMMVLIDAAAIRGVRHLPEWIVGAFDQITDFGKSGWFLWPLGILFLALASLPALPRIKQLVVDALMVRVGYLFLAIAVPGIFVNIVKHIFGRARPMVGGSLDPYLFRPFTWPADYASLPSGHAVTAISVLVAFGMLWPRARTVLWIYALLILVSRVVVTAHYPSDVLTGAVVGAVGVLLVRRWFALRGLGFCVGQDGILYRKSGPSLRRIKCVARALLSQ